MIDVPAKERQALDPDLESIVEDAEDTDGGFVYCSACGHAVARQADRMELNGGHAHRFTNPYGIQFNVGCFAQALGCEISGEPTAADTWFPGFHWRLASCESCHQHLGWYFDRAEQYFYGLILDRIQQDA